MIGPAKGRTGAALALGALGLVVALTLAGCNASALPTARAVNLCQCRADEVCVLEQCVPIGQTLLIDAASGGLDVDAADPDLSDLSDAPSGCAAVSARIAELRHGAAASADAPFDFVELEGDAGASLAGWRLVISDPDGAARPVVWLSGALSEGAAGEPWSGRWLAGWGAPADAVPARVWIGGDPLPSPLGRVALLDCEGVTRDEVAYGRWPQEAAVSAAEPTALGESLGRCPSQDGSGDPAADFVVSAAPSPGAPNASLAAAPACVPCDDAATNSPRAWLSELQAASADGADPGYIEARLDPAATDPAAFSLELWSEPLAAWRAVGPLSGTATADGVLLVPGGNALSLPAQGAALRVVGCRRAPLDALGYGDASPQPDLAPAQVIDAATSGQAVSRCPDAPDGLWSSDPAPSPGALNACP